MTMDREKLQRLFIAPHSSIKEAMHQLSDTGGKIIFVADAEKRLLGTITDGDIRRGILAGLELNRSVESIMKSQFVFVLQNDEDMLEKAKTLMRTHLISQIPILNESRIIQDVIVADDYLVDSSASSSLARCDTPVVIMAGGKGTRLDPFTAILPKPLIPLHNKPIVEHIMEQYFKQGFYKFILVINHKKELIKMYFSEMQRPYEINFVEEEEYYGTAGGLELLKEQLQETFFVTNCDTILKGNYLDIIRWHKARQHAMTIIGSHKPMKVPYGILKMSNGNFLGIEEKPEFDMFINTGTYVVEPTVLAELKEKESLDMDQLILRVYADSPGAVGVYPHWKDWFDIGQWAEYQDSVKKLEKIYGAS